MVQNNNSYEKEYRTDSSHFNKDNHISHTITISDENACRNHFFNVKFHYLKHINVILVLFYIFCTVIIC